MASNSGTIVLMGSGELTATMVEVHKSLLASITSDPKAVFLDTPAGFQPNVDQISAKAVEFFRTRVKCAMEVASFKSSETDSPVEVERSLQKLRDAHFVLIGPGSPTYAVRHWLDSPVPKILTSRIEQGNCLVAASAAALTVGRFTLPVYEIYKVGEDLHWVEGMDLLGRFGFDLVVIPHWNNAEGGTHDTRFCFMGEQRFRELELLLPTDTAILGLEEHTACLIDLGAEEFRIDGIGNAVLRKEGQERIFSKGDRFCTDVLRGEAELRGVRHTAQAVMSLAQEENEVQPFWSTVHDIEQRFSEGLENNDAREAARALLNLDYTVWKGFQDLESEESIAQAREILRDLLVLFANRLESSTKTIRETLYPLIEDLVRLRSHFRKHKRWEDADAIRQCLENANIAIEDTPDGSRWRAKD